MTVDDFIDKSLSEQDFKFSWKMSMSIDKKWLELSFDLNDFSWKSLENISYGKMNMFLSSDSYQTYKTVKEKILGKRKRLNYMARSLYDLKCLIENDGLNLDLNKIFERDILNKLDIGVP